MTSAGVEVEGIRQLRASLGQLSRDLDDFRETNARAGSLVVTEASRLAPRRTGRLAASGRSRPEAAGATISWGVPYAAVINFGTGPRPGRRGPHNIRATRFASRALDDAGPTVTPWYLSELNRKVSRVKGAPIG